MIRSRPFTVTVTELRPREAMRWRGGLPFGLAVIERTYSLDAQDDGGTVLTVREDHTGPLAGLLGPDDAGPQPLVPPVLRRAQGAG